MIVPAHPSDHKQLTHITKKSKAYWGYSPEQLTAWDKALTITTEYIQEHIVYKLLQTDTIIGYYSLQTLADQTMHLDNLFILPEYIGKGCGNLLLNHAVLLSTEKAFFEITLHADPNAKAFYLKKGFEVIGQLETSIAGRFLPIMRIELY